MPPRAGARRVAVAMSGGVDSAAAAALLLDQGYQVVGLTMRLWKEASASSGDEVEAAAAVCRYLGIIHHVWDGRELFKRAVVNAFLREYARGRTPNPCLVCNRTIKFGALLDEAMRLGCETIATGHYARIERGESGYRLLTALDPSKDQSYVLYSLTQAQLGRVLLPLGMWRKADVRALALSRGLPVATREESQDVCFLRDNDYRRFMAEQMPEALRPGEILNRNGEHLGQHRGLPFYTIGQREGLGIAAPRPLYVMRLDMARNALIVGYAEELGKKSLIVEDLHSISGASLPEGMSVEAKIRYRARRMPAQVWPLTGSRARVTLAEPLRDITPGQGCVFYWGEEVLGGGIIAQAEEEEAQ